MTTKNSMLLDVTPYSRCKNRCFGDRHRFNHHTEESQSAKNNVSSNLQLKLLVTTAIDPS
jgi:hypothetical protein